MSNRKNEDEVLLLDVDDSVGESSDQASSRVFMEHLPCVRKLLDPVNREKDLPEQFISKAGSLAIVVLDGIVKLDLRDMKESDSHSALYSARTSSADTVAAVPDL